MAVKLDTQRQQLLEQLKTQPRGPRRRETLAALQKLLGKDSFEAGERLKLKQGKRLRSKDAPSSLSSGALLTMLSLPQQSALLADSVRAPLSGYGERVRSMSREQLAGHARELKGLRQMALQDERPDVAAEVEQKLAILRSEAAVRDLNGFGGTDSQYVRLIHRLDDPSLEAELALQRLQSDGLSAQRRIGLLEAEKANRIFAAPAQVPESDLRGLSDSTLEAERAKAEWSLRDATRGPVRDGALAFEARTRLALIAQEERARGLPPPTMRYADLVHQLTDPALAAEERTQQALREGTAHLSGGGIHHQAVLALKAIAGERQSRALESSGREPVADAAMVSRFASMTEPAQLDRALVEAGALLRDATFGPVKNDAAAGEAKRAMSLAMDRQSQLVLGQAGLSNAAYARALSGLRPESLEAERARQEARDPVASDEARGRLNLIRGEESQRALRLPAGVNAEQLRAFGVDALRREASGLLRAVDDATRGPSIDARLAMDSHDRLASVLAELAARKAPSPVPVFRLSPQGPSASGPLIKV